MASPRSLTGKYLTGEMMVPVPERRSPNTLRTSKVVRARGNNLKGITAEITLGLFTCVTGVSGGGKSTLLIDTLYASVARKLNGASLAPAPHDRIEGLEEASARPDVTVFCAGVAASGDGGGLMTAGGRVLAVTGEGPTIAAAREAAYAAAEAITWPGRYIRNDIAASAAEEEQA